MLIHINSKYNIMMILSYISQNGSQSFDGLAQCLGEIRAWLASSFFHLNTNKTECVVFGPSSASKEIISRLASMKISVSDHVKNLGVIMASSLVLDNRFLVL